MIYQGRRTLVTDLVSFTNSLLGNSVSSLYEYMGITLRKKNHRCDDCGMIVSVSSTSKGCMVRVISYNSAIIIRL